MILAALLILAFYVLIAPDQSTASIRSGAGAAIGSVARSTRSGTRQLAKSRSSRARSRRSDRVAKWGQVDAAGNPVDPWGPTKLWIEKRFGIDGSINDRFRSAGTAIGRATRSGLAAVKSGWATGKNSGRPGPPRFIAEAIDDARVAFAEKTGRCTWRTGTRSSIHRMCGAEVEPGTFLCPTHIAELRATGSRSGGSAPDSPKPPAAPLKPSGPDQPAGAIEGKPVSTPITAEAGLLQAAEQIAKAASELAALIAAAEAARTLHDSLGFDPGASVSAAITALAEVAPDPAGLNAFTEMATGLVTAIKAQSTALIGA